MKTVLSLVAATVLLAGCNDHAKQGATEASAPPTASAQTFQQGIAVTASDFVVSGVSLTVQPNPYSKCDFPNGGAVVSVGYDARPAGYRHTQIWLQQPNGRQMLWGQSPGQIPAKQTGKWVQDGMKVLLVEVGTGKLVALTTIHAAPCH